MVFSNHHSVFITQTRPFIYHWLSAYYKIAYKEWIHYMKVVSELKLNCRFKSSQNKLFEKFFERILEIGRKACARARSLYRSTAYSR